MTPPVGACLACGISKLTIEQLSREIFPFILVVVAVLLLITVVPEIRPFPSQADGDGPLTRGNTIIV